MTNLILSGGVAHDYAATSPMVADALAEVGIRSDVSDDPNVIGAGGLRGYDLLTINCVWWTCKQTPDWHADWHFELSEAARGEIVAYLASGKGIVALHAATICFDDWPEYANILGGYWDWDAGSTHLDFTDHRISMTSRDHPITRGLGDFTITDELYTNPRIVGDIEVLAEGTGAGAGQPIVWTHEYGASRIAYDALGHGVESFGHATHKVLLQRCAQWVTRTSGDER